MTKDSIILMGFMSSGKSKLGKSLAKKMGLNFMDLDEEIEKLEQASINEIFSKRGEEYFRKRESEVLERVLSADQKVIALGGGTPCNPHNFSLIKAGGFSVYLKIDPEILLGRLRQNHKDRPLIKDKSAEELKEYVYSTLASREAFYQQADLIIKQNNLGVQTLLEKIQSAIT